jgi:hypothetical protein
MTTNRFPFRELFGTLASVRGRPRRGRIGVTRMRAGLFFLILAALLAAGAQATIALAQDPVPAGTTATGATGVQSATSCPKPRLTGLPKRPKFTNATIHFKLTKITVGSVFLISAGYGEVYGATAETPTVKGKFLLPDQGTKDKTILIKAVVDTESCTNAPWKLQKKINYKAVTPATPTTPATPAPGAPAAANPAAPTPAPAVPPVKPVKPVKVKPVKAPWQIRPEVGTKLSLRTWIVPIDGASRMQERVAQARLSRLEQETDKASSSNALVGLGLVGALFMASTIAGLWVFVRRDEVQFERAMAYQLKHLEEGDFSVLPDEGHEEGPPLEAIEDAPFVDPTPVPSEAPTEPIAAATPVPPVPAPSPADVMRHRREVEEELQRVLNEAGLEAELQGILVDARHEAERQGVALDTDLMLQALCDEINGSAKLSDVKREQLRTMFASIIAEESQKAAAPESVATP